MNFLTLFTSLVLCVMVLPVASFAQTDNYGRWEHGFGEPAFLYYPREESDPLRTRWQLIEAENKGRADEWAGDYVE